MHSPTTTTGRRWRAELPPVAALAAAVTLFFWPVLSGRAWLPAGGGDLVALLFPMYRFAAASLRAGDIPLWNPYLYAGAPFVADNQSGLFYPINLLLFLLWPDFPYEALQGLVAGHFFLAGLAMYICLRLLRLGPTIGRGAALLGALAFMFSGVFVTHIGNLNLNAVAAWLPLAFLGLQRAVVASNRRQRLGWIVASGLALGVSTLAGHGQMSFLLVAFLTAYALFEAIRQRRGQILLWLGALLATAGGVAAVALLPAVGGLDQTVRSAFDAAQAGAYSLPWSGLVGLIAPDFYCRGIHRFWGDWSRVEYGYAGVLTWLLAATALAHHRRWRSSFFILAVPLLLLLALGENAPLFPLLLRLAPFFPFQAPARFVLLVDFCLAVLAAVGAQILVGDRPLAMGGGPTGAGLANHSDADTDRESWWSVLSGQRLLVGLAVGIVVMTVALLWHRAEIIGGRPERAQQTLRAVLVLGGLAAAGWLLLLLRMRGRLSGAYFVVLAALLLAADLIGLGRYTEVEWNDPTAGFPLDSPALAFLQNDPGLHRVDIATGAWQPSLPQLAGVYGLKGVFNPLALANYSVYIGAVGYRGSPQYNRMGVKYVVGGKEEPPGDTSFLVPVFDQDPAVTVYLNTHALPRAMVFFEAVVATDHDQAFALTHAESYDPARNLVVEDGRPLAGPAGASTIEILSYELNRVGFAVANDRPAYFLLSDMYHPHWRAGVDGVETEIKIADYAFRAVYLEPGQHTVVMWFEPAGWRWGLLISGLTWLAAVAALVAAANRNGRTR